MLPSHPQRIDPRNDIQSPSQREELGVLKKPGCLETFMRIGLVRHTTVPLVIHPELAPATVNEVEQTVRGVPSYLKEEPEGALTRG